MINHVVCRRCFKISVHFAKKNGAGAGCSGKHTVHHKELFFRIFREKFFRNKVVIKIGYEKAHNAKNKHNSPISFNNRKTDRRNSGNNHYIEEKVACPCKKEIVGIILLNCVFLFKKTHGFFNKSCRKNTEKEVESEDERSHSRKNLAQTVHKEIGYHIGYDDKRDLNGHFINAFLHRNLVFVFDVSMSFFSGFLSDYSSSFKEIKVNNSADGSA